MIARINALPAVRFPDDGGVDAGQPVGAIDFLAQGGDIANREEQESDEFIQPAAVSWQQFVADYVEGLSLVDPSGRRTPVYAVPGNHDVTNAVGFYRPMKPAIDAAALIGLYNRAMAPAAPKTSATFTYPRDRIDYSRDIGGVHFMFLTVWPDSAQRRWMAGDLATIPLSTPAIILVHDQPDAEAKHFINPNGVHDINATDRFENLLVDQFSDGPAIKGESLAEQSALERFLRGHPNIVAYFHGNANWNQFYDWTAPDHAMALHTFRVDSPIKGAVSAKDERALSFQVAAIDPAVRMMTVRECLWNREPNGIVWGATKTVSLAIERAVTQARR